jgi:CheY-like chemotaxis protein
MTGVMPVSEVNLLLVEDNDDDRFLTLRILKKLPFALQVEIAKNGDEALQRLLAKNGATPDVVLLDLQLPKIGGISLLARVRESFSPAALPVIILSSSDNPGDYKLCQELGISGYLSKPLDKSALQKQLAALIPP